MKSRGRRFNYAAVGFTRAPKPWLVDHAMSSPMNQNHSLVFSIFIRLFVRASEREGEKQNEKDAAF